MKATYRNGKMYFDDEAWALIKARAKRNHKSPKNIVVAAIKRGIKLEKSKMEQSVLRKRAQTVFQKAKRLLCNLRQASKFV